MKMSYIFADQVRSIGQVQVHPEWKKSQCQKIILRTNDYDQLEDQDQDKNHQ